MIRRAYLAGKWYPGDALECSDSIRSYAALSEAIDGFWRAAVVPHAGWYYSGKAMARAYSSLAARRRETELIVVFGAHRGPKEPHTVFLEEGWQTPLGVAQIDRELSKIILNELDLQEEPCQPAHPDNAVEVQLPFLRYYFPHAAIVVLGVAPSQNAIELGYRVGELCRDSNRDAVFIGSTDLTHYGPGYGFIPQGAGEQARRWVRDENDRGFLDFLIQLNFSQAIEHACDFRSACCPGAAVAAFAARQSFEEVDSELKPQIAMHYLSYELCPSSNFVGYGSLMF
tara:strand:- start:454 stop:1308 length:855 start_codon:yes stop_codon:yes gene_type:complete